MDLLSTSHFVLENDFVTMETMEEEGPEDEEEEDVIGEEEDEESMKAQTEDDLYDKEAALRVEPKQAWVPIFYSKAGREVHCYAGQEIIIQESIDSYGAMVWPAALALSEYLVAHREQVSLLDKTVLDLGAGTGLQSIVAALLGAWVTATDLPEILGNLRVNLSKNTRGRCRHPPQVEVLSWGPDLERTHPRSVHHYDYVLAADVVYHHDFLDELLVTMKHFCQPGTTLIWANKVRFDTDLTFTENFKKAFHTSMLAEDGEMKIFMATSREGETGTDPDEGIRDGREAEEERESEEDTGEREKREEEEESDEERWSEDEEAPFAEKKEEDGRQTADTVDEDELHWTDEEETREGEAEVEAEVEQSVAVPVWAPIITTRRGRDIYHYAGEEIDIHEALDSFGAVMWPAALALCHFLDTSRLQLDLRGKEVLELGSGTGLVAIVASLLGAAVTATDLPEVLENLKSNLMRNTRGRCTHTPQVEELSWGHGLERNYPRRLYYYDYVLAADVVYHHEFLDELLVTMKHFCQHGTTLIWANRVRFATDLTFTENFKKAFHTSMLAEDGEMKIFMATSR